MPRHICQTSFLESADAFDERVVGPYRARQLEVLGRCLTRAGERAGNHGAILRRPYGRHAAARLHCLNFLERDAEGALLHVAPQVRIEIKS